jgi:hypothetical protein
MDKVRFGRALGYGARHTAKALYKAVDAARTPSITAPQRPAETRKAIEVQPPAARTASATQAARGTAQLARALGKSVWTPVKRFSGVLWLQVTGSVYAVIALAMGQATWLHRADLRLSIHAAGAQRAYLLLGIFLLFAYFALSSFVRATRLERR